MPHLFPGQVKPPLGKECSGHSDLAEGVGGDEVRALTASTTCVAPAGITQQREVACCPLFLPKPCFW